MSSVRGPGREGDAVRRSGEAAPGWGPCVHHEEREFEGGGAAVPRYLTGFVVLRPLSFLQTVAEIDV